MTEQIPEQESVARDQLESGEITFQDFLRDYAKEMIQAGLNSDEVNKAISHEIFQMNIEG